MVAASPSADRLCVALFLLPEKTRLTRQVAVIGLADLERRALRGRSFGIGM